MSPLSVPREGPPSMAILWWAVLALAACGGGSPALSDAGAAGTDEGGPAAGEASVGADALFATDLSSSPPADGEPSADAADAGPTPADARADRPALGTTYYVNSTTGKDSNSGRAPTEAWRSLAKVAAQTFKPGDVVRFQGTFTDRPLRDPGQGTAAAPILFVGDGPFSGRARLLQIQLTKTQHVVLRNFEASGDGVNLVTTVGSDVVRYVRFENLYLHDGNTGVSIAGSRHQDLTFVDTRIEGMWMDGVLLGDAAGDRFTYLRGSIKKTGRRGYVEHWNVHGVYASGGHGHVFDGIEFSDNPNGVSLSIRRGNTTVRNCRFANEKMVFNNNEDEGSKSPYTGSPSKGLTYLIHGNVFVGGVALYQGSINDKGVLDPGNRWVIFNNTFVNSKIDFGPSSQAQSYAIYFRNNALVGSSVAIESAAKGQARVVSHNGFWKSGTPQGTSTLVSDPALDAAQAVTAAAYKDAGTAAIAPGVTLAAGGSPLGYLGAAPDVGARER